MEIEGTADECQLGCLDNQECFLDNGQQEQHYLAPLCYLHYISLIFLLMLFLSFFVTRSNVHEIGRWLI